MTVPAVPAATYSKARVDRLVDELRYAWRETPSSTLTSWAAGAGVEFSKVTLRRASNVLNLLWAIGVGLGRETRGAVAAFDQGRLADHLSSRTRAAGAAVADAGTNGARVVQGIVRALRTQPAEVAPELLTATLVAVLVSGGPDGDGGAPDLDLMLGIDSHRSLLCHSILLGGAIETGLLSTTRLVQVLHGHLPREHDPFWDVIAANATRLLDAANKGASVGIAYHLLVDGIAQPAAYKDLPVSLPIEGHQAIFVGNAVAEALDVAHKERATPNKNAASTTEQPRARLPVLQSSVSSRDLQRPRHLEFRQRPFTVEERAGRLLNPQERLLLNKYGSWLQALDEAWLEPMTAEQEHFVRASWGMEKPTTDFERVWAKYKRLLRGSRTG